MQIPHIQPMRESKLLYTTYGLVAFALALGLLSVAASVRVTARTDAPPGPLTGNVSVIDGDTITVGEARLRLEGIDAPEGLPALESLRNPDLDLSDLDSLQETVDLIAAAGLT